MSGQGFQLEPRLAQGGVVIGDLSLCTALLKLDARWPWVILVPRAAGVSELHDLNAADRHALIDEVALASRAVGAEPGVAKVNVAALGNQVRQLHVHVIGRWPGDVAWPEAVFGVGGKTAYDDGPLAQRLERLRARLLA